MNINLIREALIDGAPVTISEIEYINANILDNNFSMLRTGNLDPETGEPLFRLIVSNPITSQESKLMIRQTTVGTPLPTVPTNIPIGDPTKLLLQSDTKGTYTLISPNEITLNYTGSYVLELRVEATGTTSQANTLTFTVLCTGLENQVYTYTIPANNNATFNVTRSFVIDIPKPISLRNLSVTVAASQLNTTAGQTTVILTHYPKTGL